MNFLVKGRSVEIFIRLISNYIAVYSLYIEVKIYIDNLRSIFI